MNSKFTLGLLLLMAGGLIYAATHHQQGASQWSDPQASQDAGHRLSRLDGTARPPRTPDLGWLGPVRRIDRDELARRMDSIVSNVLHEVATVQDPAGFQCRQPAEVGPVPQLDAVDAWLDGLPASRHDRQLTRALYHAAAEGNWLARVQVYALLAEQPARDNTTVYRTVQLMEWLQAHGIGALHGLVGEALRAAQRHDGDDAPAITASDMFAALHHSYPAQHKVGSALRRSADPQLAAAGQRMIDCAAHALPAYGRMFGLQVAQSAAGTWQ